MSAGNPSKRVLKKGKKIPRNKDDHTIVSSKGEVTIEEPAVLKQAEVVETSQIGNVEVFLEKGSPTVKATRKSIERGEEKTPVDLFSLNISEEVASIEAASHQDEATCESQRMKRQCSRSPSQSSGEGPLKKKKIVVDLLITKNVAADSTEEVIVLHAVIGENLILTVLNGDNNQGSLIHPSLIQENVFEDESVAPNDDLMAALSSMDPVINIDTNNLQDQPTEMDESVVPEKIGQRESSGDGNTLEELLIDKSDTIDRAATSEQEMRADAGHSNQQLEMTPAAGSTERVVVEQVMTTESHVISFDEFMDLKTEILRMKEELAVVKGELNEVKGELNEMKARISETDRSEHTINGAICLLQKLVRKGLIPPDISMNPALWSSP